jgi:hypothetical protein
MPPFKCQSILCRPEDAEAEQTYGAEKVEDIRALLMNRRVKHVRPLVPPQILLEDLPPCVTILVTFGIVKLINPPRTVNAVRTVLLGRAETTAILNGKDDRLMVVVGPCSVHDPEDALEYAKGLREYAKSAKDDLLIVMRVYFEKPRTTVGWKGLINGETRLIRAEMLVNLISFSDPDMDGTFRVNKGLRLARSLLVSIAELGACLMAPHHVWY